MVSGAWLGSMMPPAPSRMRLVCAPTCAMSTLVADDAMLGMLWCSAYQTRWKPVSSARWASATLAAIASVAVAPGAMGARSRTDTGMRMVGPFTRGSPRPTPPAPAGFPRPRQFSLPPLRPAVYLARPSVRGLIPSTIRSSHAERQQGRGQHPRRRPPAGTDLLRGQARIDAGPGPRHEPGLRDR